MKVTITLEINSKLGGEAFADEVMALLPNRGQIKDFRKVIIPAVLPVTFRLIENSARTAFVEFAD